MKSGKNKLLMIETRKSPSQMKGCDVRFDETDLGWIVMSIGMAIGAGIVFLPVQVGLVGLWVFLLSSAIGYPGMYLFQRLFIKTLCGARESQSYPQMIASYLGKRWGLVLGLVYLMMLTIWMFVYATAITRDSASYLKSFGLTDTLLSQQAWYGLLLVTMLVLLASRGERLLFRFSSFMVLTKLAIVGMLGLFMVSRWNASYITGLPAFGPLVKETIVTLPFTLTSILFIQTLSPMVIAYRAKEKSLEVARYKSLRAMNIAFGVLFITVFFYALSFTFSLPHEAAVAAYKQNISALAITAQNFPGSWASIIGVVLNIFAVMTAFFGVYLGFKEACYGLIAPVIKHYNSKKEFPEKQVTYGIMLFSILLSWTAIVGNFPVLSFTVLCSPIFGILGCLVPAWLVYKVPELKPYRGYGVYFVVFIGLLLCISPVFKFWS
ncbi:amino acid permease [Acetobacter sp. P1H12_c]|uniref:amino acid permease n=1 Tax=Acetobacter sp. P1H12_c TaxID=2762621 RepID=UPI001C05B5D2|nr:amino acid permease [Acetobacter sp. P1H12_c]